MTKFKVGDIESFESITTVSKTIRITEENNRGAMIITMSYANVSDHVELSKKLESAIRRALK